VFDSNKRKKSHVLSVDVLSQNLCNFSLTLAIGYEEVTFMRAWGNKLQENSSNRHHAGLDFLILNLRTFLGTHFFA
jgi:hypothetical protein